MFKKHVEDKWTTEQVQPSSSLRAKQRSPTAAHIKTKLIMLVLLLFFPAAPHDHADHSSLPQRDD